MGEPTPGAAQREPPEFAHRSWHAHPGQLAPLRAEVRRWLAPFALTEDTEDDLVLAVSEAASNSIEHAYTPPTADDTVELTFWTEPHAICVTSWTTASGAPPPTNPPDAVGESRSCSGSSGSC